MNSEITRIGSNKNEEQYRWLTDLIFDSKELDKLGGMISEFNLFEAMGMIRQEIRHSHFLGALFNPRESHGLGSRFFESIFSQLLYGLHHQSASEISLLDIDLNDYDDLLVFREQERIDLLLVSEKNKQVFVIENKIDASEHGNQLERYEENIQRRYPNHRKVFVFLTLDGREASRDGWLSLSYNQVITCLSSLLTDYGHQIPISARIGIEHYITLFRRYFMEDTEIAELCHRIYKKHQKALDLIFEHSPQKYGRKEGCQQWVASVLEPYLSKYNWVEDFSTRSLYRYAFQPWDNKQPEMQSSSWTKSGRVVMFEFQCTEKKIQLKLIIGPSKFPEFRKNIYERAINSDQWRSLYSRKVSLTSEWTSIYGRNLLSHNDLDTMEEIDFCSRLQQSLDIFFTRDWPIIRDLLSPLFTNDD